MTRRTHPANSPTPSGHTGSVDFPKSETRNSQPALAPGPQSLAPAFLFPIPWSLDPSPCFAIPPFSVCNRMKSLNITVFFCV
jgi:hypothetical protein